jgi:hypothetical protein
MQMKVCKCFRKALKGTTTNFCRLRRSLQPERTCRDPFETVPTRYE